MPKEPRLQASFDLITKYKDYICILFVVIIASVLRVSQLGYSHFYGDEVKTLYLDKTVPAASFFLDQRKGPIQFIVVWITEKVSGGFDEFWIRLPFALASIVSVFVFYLLLRKIFNSTLVSLISSILFALNGFYIAFGRTAQYQSFYILFGLLAFYFLAKALKDLKSNTVFYFLSGISLGLAFLSHYDAVFFLVPMTVYYITYSWGKFNLRQIVSFLLPFLIITLPFYLPYILFGYFDENTVGYIAKRIIGKNYAVNDSLYSISIYNPLYTFFVFLLFVPFAIKSFSVRNLFLLVWLVLPLVVFEMVFRNPGTHIHNYVIPIIIVIGLGVSSFISKLKFVGYVIVAVMFFYVLAIQSMVFIPGFSTGYPYKDTTFYGLPVPAANTDKHLFLYGFPYYRGWDKISVYVKNNRDFSSYYTNEDTDISTYYLRGLPVTPPGSNFLPKYYIYIQDSQVFNLPSAGWIFSYEIIEYIDLGKEGFAKILRKL